METLATPVNLVTVFNWTLPALVIVFLAMFVVEGLRILGRASDKSVKREPFDAWHYFSQFVNWFPIVLNVVIALLLLAVRDSLVDTMGLAVKDPATFELWYAFGVGVSGQLVFGMAVRAFGGMFGAFNGTPAPPPGDN